MIRGERLRILREDSGYSREKLAELLQIGVAQVYRYETEKADPSSDVVRRIAQFFGVSTDYLIGLTDLPSQYASSDLSEKERAVIDAVRRDDVKTALKLIAEQV